MALFALAEGLAMIACLVGRQVGLLAVPFDYVRYVGHLSFWRLAQWRISEHKTVNTPQKLMRGRMFN
jgi:hypothetical protein